MHHHIFILASLVFALNIINFACAISGGNSAQSSEQYPFSVTLTNPILCGGSIISLDPAYILTAAHCIENFNINDETSPSVSFGNRNFSQQTSAYIKRVVTHPMYISVVKQKTQVYPFDTTDTAMYDIGLIELSRPLVADTNVNRIQFYQKNPTEGARNMTEVVDNNDIIGLKTLETIGMGYTGMNEPHAPVLQYTECTLSNTTTLRNERFDDSIVLVNSDARLCHGDSGSPLLSKISDNTEYLLTGVLNKILNAYDPDPENTSCPLREINTSDFVNLFVKPSSHMEWISHATGLPKSALIEPVKQSNNNHLFSSSSSSSSATYIPQLYDSIWKITMSMLMLYLFFPIIPYLRLNVLLLILLSLLSLP